ncbi:hypothetical protein J4401_03000 [Candidatus Woesearchaeota archaeon]|nr:hypothetical protein [Candidatus Woesearchaeota archaeon]
MKSKKGDDRTKKRAQISVFVVLGVVVLASVAMFLYFRSSSIAKPDIKARDANPISNYVEGCIEESANEAITLLGQQGGYITMPLNIVNDPSRYYSPDGNGILKMPLWFYKGNKFNPGIRDVQDDISEYVSSRISRCINDFQPFINEYDIEAGQAEATTFLNKEDVTVNLKYPLKITYKGNSSSTSMSDFSISVPVRLRKLIETAGAILDSELKDFFLENFTIDLMTSNHEIPFTDMEFTCSRLEWKVSDIKEKTEQMLRYSLPRVRVKNTLHRPFAAPEREYEKLLAYTMEDIAKGNFPKNAPEDSFEYLRLYWDPGLEKDNSISVALSLPSQGIELTARPNDDGILRANTAEGSSQYLRFLCIGIYHFVYDLNFPVLFALKDTASYGGEGYIFNFAIPATIKNNEPYKLDYGYDLFTTTYFDRGFCDDRGDETADIRAIGYDGEIDNTELNRANISLECIRYFCPLGMTSPSGGKYRLITTLPASCANPFITAEKDGYLKAKAQLISDRLDIKMTRLKDMDYGVVMHMYNSLGDVMGSPEELGEDMNVSIQLLSGDFVQYNVYPIQQDASPDIGKIRLIEDDAEYELQIILTQNGEYVGGYSGTFSAGRETIKDSKKIVFHILRYVPTPFTREDKLKMVGYMLDEGYADELKPTFE